MKITIDEQTISDCIKATILHEQEITRLVVALDSDVLRDIAMGLSMTAAKLESVLKGGRS